MQTNVFFSTLLSLSTLFFVPVAQAADVRQTPVSSTADVRDFSGVISNLPADVFVMQGTDFNVEISGPAEAVAAVQTTVKEGMLTLALSQPVRNASELVILITMPAITHLGTNNTGDVIVQTVLKADHLTLNVAGTGDIALTHVEAATLEAAIAGAGTIRTGQSTVNQAILAISGTGNIDMAQLVAKDCQASISGHGNIRIHADKTLNANIAGHGNVQYTGSPAVQHAVTGRGEINAVI